MFSKNFEKTEKVIQRVCLKIMMPFDYIRLGEYGVEDELRIHNHATDQKHLKV
jgi:hypothetical protein